MVETRVTEQGAATFTTAEAPTLEQAAKYRRRRTGPRASSARTLGVGPLIALLGTLATADPGTLAAQISAAGVAAPDGAVRAAVGIAQLVLMVALVYGWSLPRRVFAGSLLTAWVIVSLLTGISMEMGRDLDGLSSPLSLSGMVFAQGIFAIPLLALAYLATSFVFWAIGAGNPAPRRSAGRGGSLESALILAMIGV